MPRSSVARSAVARFRTRLPEPHPDRTRSSLVDEMYQLDRARKERINSRARRLLILNGAGLVVLVPFVGIVCSEKFLHAPLLSPLIFLAGTGFLCLLASLMIARGVLGASHRMVGLDELVSAHGQRLDLRTYCRRAGTMVAENWKITQRWTRRLDIASGCFRFGLVILVLSMAGSGFVVAP